MEPQEEYFDYSQRAPWLRAVVLGGLEGLALATLWLTGVEAVTHDARTTTANEMKLMLISSILGLIAGAMRIATSELVSVYTQSDTIKFQAERDLRRLVRAAVADADARRVAAPCAVQIAVASSLAFLLWGTVPILAAGFIKDRHLRYSIAVVGASLGLAVLGAVGAALGKAPIVRSCVRVILGGLVGVSIMWGKVKIIEMILNSVSV